MHRFHFLMRDLLAEVAPGRLDEHEALARMARVIQQGLACTRVSFWRVDGDPGARVMTREVGYDGSRDEVTRHPVHLDETNGIFFDTLYRTGCYVCPDVAADPGLSIIAQRFLKPTNAQALLVAAYGANARPRGMISCVQDRPRRWTAADVTALRRCANEFTFRQMRNADEG